MARKLKTKIHFNRVNMQRGDTRVWSAHTSKACNMSTMIRVVHNGKVVLETSYKPEGSQPRAALVCYGNVTTDEHGITTIEV